MNRHAGIVAETTSANYTGLTAKLTIPSSIHVNDGYVDWYMGIGKSAIEAGISYKAGVGFKVFINGVVDADKEGVRSKPVSFLSPGQTVDMKLVYNHGTKKATLYINSKPIDWATEVTATADALKRLSTYNTVKLVHGVEDSGFNTFSQATYSSPQLRMDTAGTQYKAWTSSLSTTVPRVLGDAGSADRLYILQKFPMETRLDQA
ncbi:hypothetical protein [Paenibacillus brasilensis]|uniref:Uncharacterized protein n=1 Tax=Paenibacillus brasilensis TaxID=128574 RepID=A0ABU0KYW6_9BACL|nr:hypothetical protein [Paenibacillus brasilensis]MDQ0493780.1 hypothetical protein [Paenibacillus brasilensis]